MNQQREPTHVLHLSVPLHVDVAFDGNPLEEALRAIMPLTRLAATGAICGDVTVTVREALPFPGRVDL